MCSIVASACCASAPATPPIASYAALVSSFRSPSRFSHSRDTANASSGNGARAPSDAVSISSTSASSSNAKPRVPAGSTSARRSPARVERGQRRQRLEHRREPRVLRALHQEVVPQRHAARARRPRSPAGSAASANDACVCGGLSVNSSSNWSTTSSASPCRRRQRPTRSHATAGSSTSTSAPVASGSPDNPGTSARPRPRKAERPGVHTIAPQPAGRDATTPARTNDVFPAPDGPITAASFRLCSRCQRALTSASRPKNTAESVSVKLASPGYGLRSSISCGARDRGPTAERRLERQRQVVRRAEALLAILLETPPHDPADGRRHPARERRQLRRRLLQDRRHRRDRAVPVERVLPAQQLVQHDAQREDVRAMVDRQAAQLLGRHVADRPQHLAVARSARTPSSRRRCSPAPGSASRSRSPGPSLARRSSRTRSRASRRGARSRARAPRPAPARPGPRTSGPAPASAAGDASAPATSRPAAAPSRRKGSRSPRRRSRRRPTPACPRRTPSARSGGSPRRPLAPRARTAAAAQDWPPPPPAAP